MISTKQRKMQVRIGGRLGSQPGHGSRNARRMCFGSYTSNLGAKRRRKRKFRNFQSH